MMKAFLTILFALISAIFNAQKVTLAANGMSDYKIIVSARANAIEIQSAKLFQNYFKQISNISLQIVTDQAQATENEIIVGNTSRFTFDKSGISQDGISIKTVGKKLILLGGSRKGVLYAVSTFFENYLGVGFYSLDCIKIPKLKTIVLPAINTSYSPPFEFRSEYNLNSQDRDFADFHKLNYFFENRLYPAHSFAWLIPEKKYFKTHPEFFALIDGKRNPTQMCFSSEGLFQELIKVLKIEMQNSPNNQIWSVSALDSPNYCHCNLCEAQYKKGSGFSEALISFVNKVAAAFPDKTISTLAYNQSLLPAVNSKPAKNVEIMFCFTDVDRSKPIESAENKEAVMFRDALAAWKAQTSNLFVWDYVVNYFHSLSPFPNLYTLKPNLIYFKKMGFTKAFEQGIGPQKGELSELKTYLLAKLLWNPDLDDRAIIREFCDNFYGPSSSKILNYIESINKTGAVDKTLGVYSSPENYRSDFLSNTKISSYLQILNSALDAVPENSVYFPRIKKEILSLEYAKLINNRGIKSTRARDAAAEVSQFVTDADKIGIKFLRNGEYTLQSFQNDFSQPQ